MSDKKTSEPSLYEFHFHFHLGILIKFIYFRGIFFWNWTKNIYNFKQKIIHVKKKNWICVGISFFISWDWDYIPNRRSYPSQTHHRHFLWIQKNSNTIILISHLIFKISFSFFLLKTIQFSILRTSHIGCIFKGLHIMISLFINFFTFIDFNDIYKTCAI